MTTRPHLWTKSIFILLNLRLLHKFNEKGGQKKKKEKLLVLYLNLFPIPIDVENIFIAWVHPVPRKFIGKVFRTTDLYIGSNTLNMHPFN